MKILPCGKKGPATTCSTSIMGLGLLGACLAITATRARAFSLIGPHASWMNEAKSFRQPDRDIGGPNHVGLRASSPFGGKTTSHSGGKPFDNAWRFTRFLRVYNNSLLGPRENGNMKNTFVIKGHETTLHPNRAMTPRKLLVFASLFTTVAASVVAADTNGPAASKSDYTVALHYEKEIPLNSEAVQTLYSNAVDLLETSNFNSRAPLWDWSISKLHEQYRQTVSGKYLIVSFKVPRKFATVGGEVSVREIVIGINRPDFASALFTIDGEG
jgi:hypothetical protein